MHDLIAGPSSNAELLAPDSPFPINFAGSLARCSRLLPLPGHFFPVENGLTETQLPYYFTPFYPE